MYFQLGNVDMKWLLSNLYSQLFVQAWHAQTEPLGEKQLSAVSLEQIVKLRLWSLQKRWRWCKIFVLLGCFSPSPLQQGLISPMAKCASSSLAHTECKQHLFKSKVLIHRLWEFSALDKSPCPEHLLCPSLAGDVMLQLNPPDRGLTRSQLFSPACPPPHLPAALMLALLGGLRP